MANLNNPAARFHRLIEDGRAKKADQPAQKVWAELLGVPSDDVPSLLRRLGHVLELPLQIADAVRNEPDANHDLMLRWLPKVQRSFQVSILHGNWKNFIDHYDDATVLGLEVCADLLSRNRPEQVINDDDLNEIEKLLSDLVSELDSAADLEPALVDFLRRHADVMRTALADYRIKGIVEIRKAFEASIGAFVLQPRAAQEALAKSSAGKTFWRIVVKVGLVLSMFNAGLQLPDQVTALLGSAEEQLDAAAPSEPPGSPTAPESDAIDSETDAIET